MNAATHNGKRCEFRDTVTYLFRCYTSSYMLSFPVAHYPYTKLIFGRSWTLSRLVPSMVTFASGSLCCLAMWVFALASARESHYLNHGGTGFGCLFAQCGASNREKWLRFVRHASIKNSLKPSSWWTHFRAGQGRDTVQKHAISSFRTWG